MQRNFAVYTRTGCPYCDRVKQVLAGKGFNYREYKLGEHFDRESFYQQFGQGSTFPQVVVDGKKLGGCSSTANFLQENKLIA